MDSLKGNTTGLIWAGAVESLSERIVGVALLFLDGESLKLHYLKCKIVPEWVNYTHIMCNSVVHLIFSVIPRIQDGVDSGGKGNQAMSRCRYRRPK